MQDPSTYSERFSRCRELIIAADDPALMRSTLSEFQRKSDSHLPQHLLQQSIRETIEADFQSLCQTPYFGERKLQRFLDILERVADRAKWAKSSRPKAGMNLQVSIPVALHAPDAAQVTAFSWQTWCDTIRSAGIDNQPLGRFVASLADLPRNLWRVEIRELTSRSFKEICEMTGYGPARLSLLYDAVGNLATALGGFASFPYIRARAYPRFIHDAASWLEHALYHRTVPTAEELRYRFLTPLFKQLDTDLGTELTELIRRRVGVDRPPETLDTIAADRGVTRERIRQLTSRALEVITVRWPEGKHLLDDLYELLLSANSTTEQVAIISSALDELFDVADARSASRSEVLAMWERAGRANRTPMTREEVMLWACENVPYLKPETAALLVMHDALSCETDDGTTVYFSRDQNDLILHHIYATREPIALYDSPDFVDADERNVRCRLERDPRFIEDEYKRFQASEMLSVRRRHGRWSMSLVAAPSHNHPRQPNVSLDCLTVLVVTGLTQHGVADATVWGVHRFVNEVFARLYGAQLPEHITPFILSSLLIQHSEGTIRPMRRRRLRWDCANNALPVRGKYGWIDYVVTKANVPMTIDDLNVALRRYYQDYERYVLAQLSSDGDEDGGGLVETSIIPGCATRIPQVFVSRKWAINDAADNVSEGIRLFGSRIIAAKGKQRFTRHQLKRLPWMVLWCEMHSYGQIQWADDDISEGLQVIDGDDWAELEPKHPTQTHLDVVSPPEPSETGPAKMSDEKIAGILSRFL
jgi:hypothetical protein